MKTSIVRYFTLISLLCSPLAFSHERSHYDYHPSHDRYDRPASYFYRPHNYQEPKDIYAKVVRVEPIYKKERHSDNCYSSHYHKQRYGAELMGGIIGGTVGAAISDDRPAPILVGAVVGAALAHQWDEPTKATRHNRDYRCDSRHTPRIKGYNVTYRHRGELYQTFTKEHPGRFVRLEVSISRSNRH